MKIHEHLLANPPAFPTVVTEGDGSTTYAPGLTKREYIAVMALQGMLASSKLSGDLTDHETATIAVEYADALLKALESRR